MKKPSLPALRRKLDKVFGAWIRKRDTNNDGWGNCVTCGQKVHFKEANAGHFISRKHLATRYDPKNVHLQCVADNLYRHGALVEYTLFMQKTYGQDVVDELMRLKRTTVKFTRSDYEEMIRKFT